LNVLTFGDMEAMRDRPQPAYPQYAEIRATAARAARTVDPSQVEFMQRLARQHGPRWCQAVLGWPCSDDLRTMSAHDAYTLLAAHDAGLDPPACAALTDWWALSDLRHAMADQAAHDEQRADQLAYEAALAACDEDVDITPMANVNAHVRHGHRVRLVHAVPGEDALSLARRHRAGRPLCEAPDPARKRTRTLEYAGDAPVTCLSCLTFMRQIHPARAL
jgi:hypothetical protein